MSAETDLAHIRALEARVRQLEALTDHLEFTIGAMTTIGASGMTHARSIAAEHVTPELRQWPMTRPAENPLNEEDA